MFRLLILVFVVASAVALWASPISPSVSSPPAGNGKNSASGADSAIMSSLAPVAQLQTGQEELVAGGVRADLREASAGMVPLDEASQAAIHVWLENVFDYLDENGDGVLNEDEMPSSLRAQLQQWDANHDGFIDLKEFKLYVAALARQFLANGNESRDPSLTEPLLPSFPTSSDDVSEQDLYSMLRDNAPSLSAVLAWAQSAIPPGPANPALQGAEASLASGAIPGSRKASAARNEGGPFGLFGSIRSGTSRSLPKLTASPVQRPQATSSLVRASAGRSLNNRPTSINTATQSKQQGTPSPPLAPAASTRTSAITLPADVLAAITPSSLLDTGNPYWTEREQQNEARLAQGHAPILFLGDSITDWFAQGAGTPIWDTFLAPQGAVDFAVAGSTTSQVLWQVASGQVAALSPDVVVLMIGTNNLAGGQSPLAVEAGLTFIVNGIRSQLPNTRILLLGILPRGRTAAEPLRAAIDQVNAFLPSLQDGHYVTFLDIGSRFLEPDGTIPDALMADALHPTLLGYEVMLAAIWDYL